MKNKYKICNLLKHKYRERHEGYLHIVLNNDKIVGDRHIIGLKYDNGDFIILG